MHESPSDIGGSVPGRREALSHTRTRHLTERLPITFTSTLSRSRRLHNPRSSYSDREICLNLWGHLWLTLTRELSDAGADWQMILYGQVARFHKPAANNQRDGV